ncbi:OmpA family protein [Qipengyuania marisflavi]|uniref:OmpA family protein n=1 Tax=Qipengyuania marisflavi TaxID=2486356 RepID=A0A5S3P585_9SPHN|nr:OmpA family protein [Qipengyuania marisflavi]TMM48114.1 OmpA family protein [Qipengyuania marisflavi]
MMRRFTSGRKIGGIAVMLPLVLVLAACDKRSETPPEPATEPDSGEPKSIFRPEFQVEEAPAADTLAALDTRIFFPDGDALTETALAELATIIDAPQVERKTGQITLRGHSDAGGNDAANMRASQARAEAVRDWMVENGVAEDRIVVIAFGEQNPIAPNAMPDGSPNEEGRSVNRRVDVHVATDTPPPVPEKKDATLAEVLASPAAEEPEQ